MCIHSIRCAGHCPVPDRITGWFHGSQRAQFVAHHTLANHWCNTLTWNNHHRETMVFLDPRWFYGGDIGTSWFFPNHSGKHNWKFWDISTRMETLVCGFTITVFPSGLGFYASDLIWNSLAERPLQAILDGGCLEDFISDTISGWCFGCHFFYFPRNIGLLSSSPLTHIFQRGSA